MLSMIEKKSRPKTIPCINCCIISDRMVPNLRQIIWALLNKDNNKRVTQHTVFLSVQSSTTHNFTKRGNMLALTTGLRTEIKQETITSKQDFYNQISLHLILYIIIS